ncbi:hypothetical protein [Streptomyces atratus]|uniref:hypothetical protein n=1 Tax=Streptomyces atratus TaxID=1893 RepID=UPI0033D67DA6
MPLTADELAAHVESWAPTALVHEDDLSPGPAAAFAALLGRPEDGPAARDPLPPLWHWLYFLEWVPQQDLGPDGHPLDGHFLPPVPDRQRMFAGGRYEVRRPLLTGVRTRRNSSLGSVMVKRGSSGPLLFITVRYEYAQEGEVCAVEEQDIVYRSGPAPAAPAVPTASEEPESEEDWQLALAPDPVLLFRFSALTANAHRIHYDAPYTRETEGHAGLVVHGPLLALLMLELPRRNEKRPVRNFSFRLRSPIYGYEPMLAHGTSEGDRAALRVSTGRADRHSTGEVTFA